jgi:hypothetical protein
LHSASSFFFSELCTKTLTADGADADEIKDEMAVMDVQQAYILQCLHKHDDAANIYHSVLNAKFVFSLFVSCWLALFLDVNCSIVCVLFFFSRPSDSAVLATASNNLIALRKKDEKLFDSLKKFVLLIDFRRFDPSFLITLLFSPF